MGILVMLLGAIEMMIPNIKPKFIIPAYLLIVICLSIATVIGTRKYEKWKVG